MIDGECPGRAAKAGLATVVGALVVDIVALSLDLVRLRRLDRGATLDTVGLDVASTVADVANILVPLAVLAATFTFLLWFRCCYHNLDRFGLADHDTRWSLLGWFVPGLNLVRPLSIMRELVERPAGSTRWTRGSGPILSYGWWILWLEGLAIQVGLRVIEPSSYYGWSLWRAAGIVSDLTLIAAAGCAILLVIMVGDRQDPLARRRRSNQGSWPGPATTMDL